MQKTPVSTRQWKLKLRRSPNSPSIGNTDSSVSPMSSTPKRSLQSLALPNSVLWSREDSQQDGDVVWDTDSPNAQKLVLITTGKTPVRRRSSASSDVLPCKKNIAAMSKEGNSSFAEDLAKLDELVSSEMQQNYQNGKECRNSLSDQPLHELDEQLAEALDESDEALILQATQQVEDQYFKSMKDFNSKKHVPAEEKSQKFSETPLFFEDDDMDLILCNALDTIENSRNLMAEKPSTPEPKSDEDDFFQPEVLQFVTQLESNANTQRKASAEEIERKRQEALKKRRQRLSASK